MAENERERGDQYSLIMGLTLSSRVCRQLATHDGWGKTRGLTSTCWSTLSGAADWQVRGDNRAERQSSGSYRASIAGSVLSRLSVSKPRMPSRKPGLVAASAGLAGNAALSSS